MAMPATWNGALLSKIVTIQTPKQTRQGDIIEKASLKGEEQDN